MIVRRGSLPSWKCLSSQPDLPPLSPVEVFDVRLDVRRRRAVQRVHLGQADPVPLHPLEPHDGQAQVVGTVRTPDGEDTVGLVLEEGSALNLLPVWATEVVDEDQMAELVQILQTGHLLLLELDPNLDVFLQTALDGYLPGLAVRCADDADESELHLARGQLSPLGVRWPVRPGLRYPVWLGPTIGPKDPASREEGRPCGGRPSGYSTSGAAPSVRAV
jgi:hypothetical protein